MWRWLAGLLVIALVVLGARMAYLAGWPQLAPPAATHGVISEADRGNWDQASSRLSGVLIKQFPVGSPSAEVMIKLRNQGFSPLRECPEATLQKVQGSQGFACAQNWDPQHALHYSWGALQPCRQDVAVFWTDDSGGRVTSIQGEYSCS